MKPKQLSTKLPTVVRDHMATGMQRLVLAGEGIAKREAPVKRGRLRRSITSRVEQAGRRGLIGTNTPYAYWVHEGTRPHEIRPKRKRALYWKGARHPVKVVRHPGSRGNPFFDRTLRQLGPIAAREFGTGIWAGLR